MTAKTTDPWGDGSKPAEQPPIKVKYCLYARKSTESEERQILSIDSQIKEMLQIAERENLEIVEMKRESHSAKATGQRPIFNEMINDLRLGKFNGILTWAPDRLSRNAGDLGSLVDLMDQKLLVEIRTYGQHFSNSPNEKFLLMILCSQAKLENDNRGVNIKRGQRARCEMGLWPTTPPTGYLTQRLAERKCQVIIDVECASVIKKMFEKVAFDRWSGRKLYHWLKFELNFRTKSNHHLSLGNIYVILQNTFYYGVFEYPQKSGNWYNGKHEPLISRDLFDKVQEHLKRDHIQRESKEFAFTKLIKCGECGSGITADEKFKKQKNGNVHRYVYYSCTRSRDLHCKGGAIREEDLIIQLVQLMDRIDMNELGVKKKFEEEIERYKHFKRAMFGTDKIEEKISKETDDIDFKTYAKYLLKEGSITEKRELLTNLKSWLMLKNKQIVIEESGAGD